MSRASTRAYGPGAQVAAPMTSTASPAPHHEDAGGVPHQQRQSRTHTPRKQKVQKRTAVGPWDFVKSVGAGSMGQVKLAVNRYTRQAAAIKIVPKAFTLQNSSEANDVRDARIIREAALGKLMIHENIAQLYEIYSMTSHYYLVFEYISGGQLLEYIITHGSVSEVQARRFAREIASALDYCHRNSIVHRDLKIENILISDKGHVKIIDFGLSNMFRRDDLLKTFCGSLYFAAPELLNAQPYVGPEIDVWSFGVVLYVLLCGKVPFEDMSMSVLHAKIKKGEVTYPHWLSPLCTDLLSRMLVVPPAERASLREVIHHPWMNKGYDQIVEAHLPTRVPLQLPLDSRVINEMAEMQLGEVQDIEHELKAVLSSHAYQEAVHNQHKDSYRYADPLNSFNPLISLYFLTRERLERLGQIEPVAQQKPVQPPSLQQHPTSTNPPQITLQENDDTAPVGIASHPHTPIQQQQVAFETLPSTSSSSQQQLAVLSPPARATRMRSRTQGEESRPHGLGIQQPPQSYEEGSNGNTGDDKQVGGLSNLFRHISFRKRGDSRGSSPAPRRNRNRSATTAQQNPPPNLTVNTGVAAANGGSQGLTVPTSTPGAASARTHNRAKSTSYTTADNQLQNVHLSQDAPDMPSIVAPKQVFFKGFFSVQSTSNRPLVQLRADIIRVLTDLGIEFVEIKGGFSCIHGHAANKNNTPAPAPGPPLSPSTPRQPGHARKISMGTPISSPRRDGASDSGYSSSESFEMGGSDMLGHVNSNVHSPVRFEISIVKVPVLSLHGVQFKKMGGNAWQYKTIAQEILERLRL